MATLPPNLLQVLMMLQDVRTSVGLRLPICYSACKLGSLSNCTELYFFPQGKLIDIHFDKAGKICGAKIQTCKPSSSLRHHV